LNKQHFFKNQCLRNGLPLISGKVVTSRHNFIKFTKYSSTFQHSATKFYRDNSIFAYAREFRELSKGMLECWGVFSCRRWCLKRTQSPHSSL